VRLARHLAAVLLVVAVIAALGMAWAHGDAPNRPPGFGEFGGPGRGSGRGSGPGLNLSNLSDLVQTVIIEACLIAVVVTVSAARRRRRRTRRRTVRSAKGS
jgi:hypothetical protein